MKRQRTKWPSANGNGSKPRYNGKHPGGRPSPYDSAVHPNKVYELISLYGSTDEQLAQLFDISTVTLWQWKQSHPEFLKAYNEAWQQYSYPNAERSMYQRAIGFTVPEEKVFCNVIDGKPVITRVQTERYYPPETKAGYYVLQNMSRRLGDGKWQDVSRVEHTGKDGNPIEHAKVNLHVLMKEAPSSDAIKLLRDQILTLEPPPNGKPANGEAKVYDD